MADLASLLAQYQGPQQQGLADLPGMMNWQDMAVPEHIRRRGLAVTPVLPAPNRDKNSIDPQYIMGLPTMPRGEAI